MQGTQQNLVDKFGEKKAEGKEKMDELKCRPREDMAWGGGEYEEKEKIDKF